MVSLMMLWSCSGIKKCQAPELNLPSAIMPGATDSTTLADIKWWNLYADTTLCALIDRTIANNKDILSATAKVEESRALYGVAKSNQLPDLAYNIYGNNETNDYSGEGTTNDPEIGAKVNLNWEIDFWGRLKWAKEKGKYEYLSSVEALRAAEIILIAEVADTYFRLMALDNELAIVRRTLTTRSEGMALAKLRFEAGLTSETIFQQTKVEYATTASLVPNLERRIETTMSALALLIGEYPGTYIRRGNIDNYMIAPANVSVGLPSTLLERRPDVRMSEYNLRAAMANVGISYADRFPKIAINLSAGLENDQLEHLIKSPFTYVIGSVTGPIFDFGRRKNKYRAALAAYDQAKYGYEKTVLCAFKETYDAVKTYQETAKAIRLKAALRDAALKYVELATLQYRAGSIAYIDVLDAQRRYFDAQIGLSNALRDENIALVWLYKSLGGGW